MHPSLDFCAERAREAAAQAKEAVLTNVRDRALRAEAAWLAMADKERGLIKAREERIRIEAEKLS